MATGFFIVSFYLMLICNLQTVVAADKSLNLPSSSDELVTLIRQAIETSDYNSLEKVINWKYVGKIKQRIVRFHVNRSLGRPIQSISFEKFPVDGLKGVNATGKLAANMPIQNRVRVVYDEPPLSKTGKRPTSVFLIGKDKGIYKIALVVRKPGWDDDDD